jgi:hypothetical protein
LQYWYFQYCEYYNTGNTSIVNITILVIPVSRPVASYYPKQLQQSRLCMKIGYIECGRTACADDITLNCTDPTEAQIMLNMAYNYSCNEEYKLQPQKSMVIQLESKKKSRHNPIELKLKDTILPNVESVTHLGIQRSKTNKETIKNIVNENIQKTRHTAYSLMSARFHGNNGLDPSTSIHILQTYVIPTITYGLEVLIPDKKNRSRLDHFFKKLLKQILSLPQNVADLVPYIVSGLISIEGQIHLNIQTFMYNIFLLPEDSREK